MCLPVVAVVLCTWSTHSSRRRRGSRQGSLCPLAAWPVKAPARHFLLDLDCIPEQKVFLGLLLLSYSPMEYVAVVSLPSYLSYTLDATAQAAWEFKTIFWSFSNGMYLELCYTVKVVLFCGISGKMYFLPHGIFGCSTTSGHWEEKKSPHLLPVWYPVLVLCPCPGQSFPLYWLLNFCPLLLQDSEIATECNHVSVLSSTSYHSQHASLASVQ